MTGQLATGTESNVVEVGGDGVPMYGDGVVTGDVLTLCQLFSAKQLLQSAVGAVKSKALCNICALAPAQNE